MGLDSVELVMSVEKEFGIEIPDRDAEQIQTVGGMHDYVFAKRCERDGLLMRHVFGVGTLKQTIAAGKRRLGVLISRACRWLEWIFAVFATPGLGNPHHSPKTPLTLHNPRFGSFSTGC